MADYVPHLFADDPGGGTPLNAATLNEMETGIDRASIPTKVTALPVSPYDGQEIIYEADETAGIYWRLRYRSASASSYKWEFLGGPALHDEVDTLEAVGSTGTWLNLATDGPAVTVPLDGDYQVDVMMGARNVAGSAIVACSYGVAVGNTTPADVWLVHIMAASNARAVAGLMDHLADLNASDVVKIRYQGNTTAVNFELRRLCVTPVRVG